MAVREVASYRSFGGVLKEFEHDSVSTHTPMRFSVYLPPNVSRPMAVFCLAGLTCDHLRIPEKVSTGLKTASELGLALVFPDTSPRNLSFPGFNETFTYGNAASFYVDATLPPFAENFQMFSYISKEFPTLVTSLCSLGDRQGVVGHSMGGHAALLLGLTGVYPFKAVNALSPVTNPCSGGWPVEAFSHYFGEDKSTWKQFDSTELVKQGVGKQTEIRVDVGTADEYFAGLKVREFEALCRSEGYEHISFQYHEGYSHGYYFVSTVFEEILRYQYDHLIVR